MNLRILPHFLFLLCVYKLGYAQVTVQMPEGWTPTGVVSADTSRYTAPPAHAPIRLEAPVPPQNAPTSVNINLPQDPPPNTSIPQKGDFMGFSIELSVADQIFGKNGSHISPVFLNLLANIRARAGSVRIRVGGNSQEKAVTLEAGLEGGLTIKKHKDNATNPTETPRILVGIDLIYAMANISSLINVHWIIGIPFNDTTPRLQIAELSEEILGGYLAGMQLGNEPDLYMHHGNRPPEWNEEDYMAEYDLFLSAIGSNSRISNKTAIIGPSVCCGFGGGPGWVPEDLWDRGYLTKYRDSLSEISVEHYPRHNCPIPTSPPPAPQEVFYRYLNHPEVVTLNEPYVNTGNVAQTFGKPFIMLETNTASCGGFPGVSTSFGAALWSIDHSLQMAAVNFTNAMFHVGGQNAYYNPFTPPPTNQSRFHQWTVGPPYYASLIVAETFGKSNKSRIVDLHLGSNEMATYAIYEEGVGPTKVALINYQTDTTGGHDFTANIQLQGPNPPSTVRVRYFTTENRTVADNLYFRWAGQTLGPIFGADGRMKDEVQTQTVQCNNGLCPVTVPAPSFALVFLNEQTLQESTPQGDQAALTFSTTAATVIRNTATIDQAVLSTSNGRGGSQNKIGSTSYGSSNDATWTRGTIQGAITILALSLTVMLCMLSMQRL